MTTLRPAPLLGILVCACWLSPTHFFWRDDWAFLLDLRTVGPQTWSASHSGHFFPLFRLLYWAVLNLVGANPLAFHVLALTVWWCVGLLTYEVSKTILRSDRAALLVAAVLLVHPVNSTVVLWSFELCVTVQLLLQLCALRVALRATHQPYDLLLLTFFLVAQDLFFAAGALFPLVCVVATRPWRWRQAIACSVLVLAFLTLQYRLGGSGADLTVARLLSNGMVYATTTFSRLCLAYERVVGLWSILAGALCVAVVALAIRRTRDYEKALFLSLWFFSASAPLVAGRGLGSGFESPLYYTSLSAIPGLLLLSWAVRSVFPQDGLDRLARNGGAIAIVALLALISQRAVSTFVSRSVLNRASLEAAIASGQRWRAVDDPVIDGVAGMSIDADEAKEAYLFWTR